MDIPKEEWEEGDECTGCHKKFKLTRRKHHCRFCGKIFCDSCTNQREEGKRACWQCCAAKRSASPEFGDSINRGSLPRGSTGHIPSAIAGSSVPTSPSLGPHPGPRERIYSIPASEGGGAAPYQLGTSYPQGASYQQVIMDPPPAEVSSPPVKKGKGADAAETARLKSSVVDLEAQVVTLNQELVKYQGFFTNACANLCKFEEARKQEDQEKEARGSLLSLSRGEFAKQVSERKQLFSKGKHHSKACTVCQSEYSVTKREHHCRVCFNSVCNRCSLDTIKSQRACKWCVSRATLSSPDFFKSIGASPSCALTWVSCLDNASEKIWKTAAPGVAEAPFNQ